MKTWERVLYLTVIGILLVLLLRSSDPGAPGSDRARAQENVHALGTVSPNTHATLPGGDRHGGETALAPTTPDTIRVPKALAPDLGLFLFERGTFILSRERLKSAGLSSQQIENTEKVYADAIARLRRVEEDSAVVKEARDGLLIRMPDPDAAMSRDFDRKLVEAAGSDAAIVGPNLKKSEVLSGLEGRDRQYRIDVTPGDGGGSPGIRIFSEQRTDDGEGIQSASVSENFFAQHYPKLWSQIAARLNLPPPAE